MTTQIGSLESLTAHVQAARVAAADAVAHLAYVDACIGQGAGAPPASSPVPDTEGVLEQVRALLVNGPMTKGGIVAAVHARRVLVNEVLDVLTLRGDVRKTVAGYRLVSSVVSYLAA